ncbi:MAG: hypothetical protein UZ19_OD1000695 [Parcubacteria bacterium OLB19]|nr:MAG: hypothetical protein UZ19_OD1000695 [Parcubacteria bacterium OLB19]
MEALDDLIKKAKDDSVNVSSLLRDIKVLFGEFGQTAPEWVIYELEGYGKAKVPKYRQLKGEMKSWNPYYGWVPVIHRSSEIEEKVCTRGSGQSIKQIEELLVDKTATYEMPYPTSFAEQIIEGSLKTKVSLFVSRSSMTHILETVRNKILDLLLELKKDNPTEKVGEIQKAVGGMRLPGGIALGPLMFSKDGKTASAIICPAIIPFDYGITNSLNNLNRTNLAPDEFQTAFNSQVEDLIAETLIYFQNRLKSIVKGNSGQFNGVDRCIKEYKRSGIDVASLCDVNFLLQLDKVRGRKHHTDRRYDADYTIGDTNYDSVEKLRELNRKVHETIHTLNDSLAVTHKDYDVKVTDIANGMSIEFTATSHAFDLTRGAKTVPKKEDSPKDEL